MIRRRYIAALLVAVLALFLGGCIKRGYDVFIGKCPESWTRAEKEAAWAWWLRTYYGKEEDGVWVVDPTKISVEDVRTTVTSILDDIKWILDPRRSPRWRALLLELPTLKRAFELEEKKWLYIYAQLTKVRVYHSFLELLGETVTAEDKAYKIIYLWPTNTNFNWTAPYVESAKKEGRLKKIQEGFYYVYNRFGEQIPDPSDPRGERKVWKPTLQGFWLESYAILNGDEPRAEPRPDYVEIYRARIVEGRIEHETLPCLRAFRKISGSVLEVAVIDYDHEGEPGYGEPDEVRHIYKTSGWAIITTEGTLLEQLSKSRQEEREISRTIELPPLELVVSRIGETAEYRGEFREEGWTVPYPYKDKYESNWVAEVVLEDMPDGYPYKRLAYVVKIWAERSVWEYWIPKPDYIGDLQELHAVGKNIRLQKVGGVLQELSADAIRSDQLFKIVYKEGDTWIALVDWDGVGVLQYKLTGVSPPKAPDKAKVTHSYERNL